jgi:nucleotide-binding universal stress UspA family protein
MGTKRKILCAVDFSPGSRLALRRAAELARDEEGDLSVLHVVGMLDGLFGVVKIHDQAVESADEALEDCRREAAALGAKHVTGILGVGAPSESIVHAAHERACDLIVLGTHGRTGLEHAVLGSVAEKVVRHAGCDVLVVRR